MSGEVFHGSFVYVIMRAIINCNDPSAQKEVYMNFFRDTGLLLLFSFFTIFHASLDIVYVLAFLTALILCCSDYFLELDKLLLPVLILYLFVSIQLPVLLCFYPAFAYVLLRHKDFIPAAAGLCLYFWTYGIRETDPYLLCIGIFGFILAFLLQRSTGIYEQLDTLFKRTRDDSTELNILLTEKNHALLEKQDYEIYAATLRERNRIAREIHDNVGHLLSRSILMVGALRAVNKESALSEPLETLDSTLNSAMDTIRNSVHDLHDEAINLEEAVNSLLTDFNFCTVSFHYDMSREISREIKYSFISITKEALSNIIKHSNATHVNIIMREHPALYQLLIEDNGTAFSNTSSGIGLVNMKERIQSLKGNIQIQTDKGFKIFITIPKEI